MGWYGVSLHTDMASLTLQGAVDFTVTLGMAIPALISIWEGTGTGPFCKAPYVSLVIRIGAVILNAWGSTGGMTFTLAGVRIKAVVVGSVMLNLVANGVDEWTQVPIECRTASVKVANIVAMTSFWASYAIVRGMTAKG